MEIVYLPKASQDLSFWINSGNKAVLKKIAQLTEAILQNPYQGIGKPEALKFALTGKWSRRITEEHRYIYQIENNILKVYSLKGHY
jgi:toxin YoeB